MILTKIKKWSADIGGRVELNNLKILKVDKGINTIGFLLQGDEFSDYQKLKHIGNDFNIDEKDLRFLIYNLHQSTQLEPKHIKCFNPKDFGWLGKIRNPNILHFCQQQFDILIAYYNEENWMLDKVAKMSKAHLKIGLTPKKENFCHFIIDTQPHQVELFREELEKYIPIFTQ